VVGIGESALRRVSAVGFLVGSDLIARVLQLAALTLLGRTLAPAALGDYLWAVSAATLAMLLISAGADVGGLSAVARHPALAETVWRAFVKIRTFVACLAILLALVIAAAIGGTRGLALMSAVLAAAVTALSTDFVLMGLGKHGPFATQRVAAAAVNLMLIIVFAGRSTLGALPPLWRACADAASYVASWLVVFRRQASPERGSTQVSAMNLAVESAPRLVAALLIQIYWSIDLVMLGLVATPETVAEYGIATRLMQVLAQPAAFAIFVVAPTISRASETSVRGSTRELWGILSVFGVSVVLAVALFGPLFVTTLFGAQYERAGVYLIALTVPLVGHYLIAGANATLAYSRRSRAYVLTHALGAAVAIGAALLLIPQLGVLGAIATQTLAIFTVVTVSLAINLSGRPWGMPGNDVPMARSPLLVVLVRRVLRPLVGRGLRQRFPALDQWYAVLAKRMTDRPVIVRGQPMYLDDYDSLGFLTRDYEPGTSEIISRLTVPGAVTVDVGAHIGFYTLLLSRRVGSGGTVHAFEPEAGNFQLLSRNIALNQIQNVVLENVAVSDAAGGASLAVSDRNRGDHRLVRSGDAGTITVRTVTLDGYFGGIRKPDLIKIDVQGAEWRVVAGMTGLLESAPPIIVMEWTPDLIHASGGDSTAVLDELWRRNFSLFEIREPSLDLRPVDNHWIAESRPPEFFANLLCLPPNRSHLMRLLK
jgi:FkbM family methyltransferase